jgi:putative transposase
MIRTSIIRCHLKREKADALNRASGQIYTGLLVQHWRVVRKKSIWLSEKSGTRLSDLRTTATLHAHSIDAAQQGFYKACKTAKAIKNIDPTAKYPHRRKKFRTTIWKNTAIKRKEKLLALSNGRKGETILIDLPPSLWGVHAVQEVRLVYDKKARRYHWHIVVEHGKQPKPAPGTNIVSVDLGEIHPAVVGDEVESVIITGRERRHETQGHAKRLAKMSAALSTKKKGSRRYRKFVRAKVRMKAKHERVIRDMEHKFSRAIVDVAVELKANTIVMGDVRDIADGIDKGKEHNQRMSQWNHGKVRSFVEYKAQAEGIEVVLQNEAYTTKTCPHCGHRHKPKGRTYRCPSGTLWVRFQSHRDVVGQINILSAYKFGEPGKIPAPTTIKHRTPHNLRVMRRCRVCAVWRSSILSLETIEPERRL